MNMFASRIGTAIHTGIETAWLTNYKKAMELLGHAKRLIERVRINPTDEELAEGDIIPVYMEQRLQKQVGKWTVTGKFDFVGQGRLEDFKSTTAWVYKTKINEPKFKKQGSIYRWLDPNKITNSNMLIDYIIKDWSQAKVSAEEGYPPTPIVAVTLPLDRIEDTDKWIKQKLSDIEEYWDKPEEEIPPCADDELDRTEPVFKYYSDATKMNSGGRSTKNFAIKTEAYMHLNEKGKGAVKEVPGEVMACHRCDCYSICSQKDDLIKAGHLIL
jgi:hypothetical protein